MLTATILLVSLILLYMADVAIARWLSRVHIFHDPIKRKYAEENAHLEHMYRFAEFGKMSSGFFHDLMTPLTSMSLRVEQLKSAKTQEISSVANHLDDVLDAADRLSRFLRTIRKQLEFQSSPELFDIAETIRTVLSIVTYKARTLAVAVHYEGVTTLEYYGYAAKFYQVVMNLVSNALDACESSALPDRSVVVSLHAGSDKIAFTVRDTGIGIDPCIQSKIFEPFFSTKPSRIGMGIGLAITKDIIERDFQGVITVASMQGRGSVFTVMLPKSLSFP